MAQPQPAAANPAAGPAPPGLNLTAGGPLNYRARHRQLPDTLQGAYAQLYTPYQSDSTKTGAELLERVQNLSESVPKVFLGLLRTAPGRYQVQAIHRVQRFPSHPVGTTPWDDKAFAFVGDVLPGNHIDIVRVPDDSFELLGAQRVPTTDQVDALFAAQGGGAHTMLEPPADQAADTEEVATRKLVQVPHKYVELVLDTRLTPKELWAQLGGAVRTDGLSDDCQVLMNWLRVAATLRKDPDDPVARLAPENCLGEVGRILAPLAVDRDLQHFRWTTLTSDLPALDPARLAPPDQMVALISALRQDRVVERAQEAAERAADKAPKLPSEVFPLTVTRWLQVCQVNSERDLPDLYLLWSKGTKGERRTLFTQLLETRAQEAGSATTLVPIVSKELFEMVLHAEWAPPIHSDDLTVGVNPFTCGYFNDVQGGQVAVRAQRYDLMMQGLAAPTLVEQDTFTTKEVSLPTDTYKAGMQVKGCSLVLDVALGTQSDFAQAYRSFCVREWPQIETVLHLAQAEDPDIQANVLPAILRWLQVNFASYFRARLNGLDPALPPYSQLVTLVEQRSFNLLPRIPARYRVPPKIPIYGGSGFSIGGGTSVTSGLTGETGPSNAAPPRGGALITNPKVTQNWKKALETTGKKIAEFREVAPKFTINGTKVDACLSYHLRGTCYDNCSRGATHKTLSPTETGLLSQFVKQHLQGGGGTGGSTSAAPGDGPQTTEEKKE